MTVSSSHENLECEDVGLIMILRTAHMAHEDRQQEASTDRIVPRRGTGFRAHFGGVRREVQETENLRPYYCVSSETNTQWPTLLQTVERAEEEVASSNISDTSSESDDEDVAQLPPQIEQALLQATLEARANGRGGRRAAIYLPNVVHEC